jgi:hypothetical protein
MLCLGSNTQIMSTDAAQYPNDTPVSMQLSGDGTEYICGQCGTSFTILLPPLKLPPSPNDVLHPCDIAHNLLTSSEWNVVVGKDG